MPKYRVEWRHGAECILSCFGSGFLELKFGLNFTDSSLDNSADDSYIDSQTQRDGKTDRNGRDLKH